MWPNLTPIFTHSDWPRYWNHYYGDDVPSPPYQCWWSELTASCNRHKSWLLLTDQGGARPTWCHAYIMSSRMKDQEKTVKVLYQWTLKKKSAYDQNLMLDVYISIKTILLDMKKYLSFYWFLTHVLLYKCCFLWDFPLMHIYQVIFKPEKKKVAKNLCKKKLLLNLAYLLSYCSPGIWDVLQNTRVGWKVHRLT